MSSTRRSRDEYVIVLILGLIMGSVFTFLVGYNNADIQESEALSVTAVFDHIEVKESVRRRYGRVLYSAPSCFYLHFTDHERLEIPAAVLNSDIRDALDGLAPGTTLELLLHPSNSSIVRIASGEDTLLPFDHAMSRLGQERTGFFYFGLFLYVGAAWAAWNLRPKRKKRRRRWLR